MKYTPKVHSKLAKDFDESPTLKQLLSVAINNKNSISKPTSTRGDIPNQSNEVIKEQLNEVKEYRSDLKTIAKKAEKLQKYFAK